MFLGAPVGTRTLNQLIKSQLLYQLSYRGTSSGGQPATPVGFVNSRRAAPPPDHIRLASEHASATLLA
jgi:hypothetical protein